MQSRGDHIYTIFLAVQVECLSKVDICEFGSPVLVDAIKVLHVFRIFVEHVGEERRKIPVPRRASIAVVSTGDIDHSRGILGFLEQG